MRLIAILLAAASLTACALSPQTVNVSPEIAVVRATYGNGHTVAVQATDARKDSTIGSRGGVYGKTSLIQSSNDVADAVRRQAEAGLAMQGFALVDAEPESIVRIEIEKLGYTVPEGAMATSADIAVALRVKAERGGRAFETTYRSTVTRRFPVAPTASQNEAWISETLGETLQRFFEDARMRAFLTE